MDSTGRDPPLIGRERELYALTQHLRMAAEGHGRTVFLEGEAGIGKTRLAEVLLQQAEQNRFRILRGACLSEQPVPYLPFLEAFAPLLERSAAEQLGIRRWLRGPGPVDTGGLSLRDARDRVFEALVQAVTELAHAGPLAVFLDDLHWADASSLALLHYLARNIRNIRLLLLGAYRREELGGAIEPAPLARTLTLLRVEGLAEVIGLSRFDIERTRDFLTHALRGPVSTALTGRLHAETEGNPLFLMETIRLLEQGGLLERSRDLWQLKVTARDFEIPDRVQDVVLRRVQHLSAAERETLEVAAVEGVEFRSEVLIATLRTDRTSMLRLLDRLVRGAQLIRYVNGRYRFDHAKIRDALYHALQPELLVEYHRRVAAAIEIIDRDRLDEVAGLLAHHYEAAGDAVRASDFALRSAESARRRFGNEEASHYYSQVLRHAKSIGNDAKLQALEGLAMTQYALGDFHNALQAIGQAQAILAQDPPGPRIASLLELRGDCYGHLSQFEAAIGAYQEAVQILEPAGPNPKIGELYLRMIGPYRYSGRYEEGQRCYERALEIGRVTKDELLLVRAQYALGTMLAAVEGRVRDSVRVFEEVLTLAEKRQLYEVALPTCNNLALDQLSLGALSDAITTFHRGLELARRAGHVPSQAWLLTNLSMAQLLAGRVSDALDAAEKAVAIDQRAGQLVHGPTALAALSQALLRAGRPNEARDRLAEAEQILERHSNVQGLVAVRTAEAELALVEGNHAQGRTLLDSVLVELDRVGDRRLRYTYVLPTLVRALIATSQVSEAERYLEELREFAQHRDRPPLKTSSTHLAALCALARREWEPAESQLQTVAKEYQAAGFLPDFAAALEDLGVLYKKRSQPQDADRARDYLHRAARLYADLGMPLASARAEGELSEVVPRPQ